MLEIRDTVAIDSVGDYLKVSRDDLLTAKNKLDKDIKEICEHYVGKDANVVIAKFLEATNKINPYLEVLDYYSQYMKGLSSYDKENIKSSSTGFQTITNDQIQNNQSLYKNITNVNINGNIAEDVVNEEVRNV